MNQSEAGAELDDLVHVKVMGFPKHPSGEGYAWAYVPKYSTDLTSATEVAAKLGFLVLPIDDQWAVAQPTPAGYELDEAALADLKKGIIDGHVAPLVVAPTAPLAICWGALRVVEERRTKGES